MVVIDELSWKRERERETERQRDRDRETETERGMTDRQTYSEGEKGQKRHAEVEERLK